MQDGKKDTDIRIYTPAEDTQNNYLMEYYAGSGLMNKPAFYRAVDTKGEDIYTPDFIEILDYSFWKRKT